jgi:hypothetical protein
MDIAVVLSSSFTYRVVYVLRPPLTKRLGGLSYVYHAVDGVGDFVHYTLHFILLTVRSGGWLGTLLGYSKLIKAWDAFKSSGAVISAALSWFCSHENGLLHRISAPSRLVSHGPIIS